MGEINLNKANVVYVCFLMLGLGTLLPWNFFITAESYWQYKFRNPNPSNDTIPMGKTDLQLLYTPMQVCFSQIPNFLFLFINALYSDKIPQRIRMVVSLTLMIIFFSITTALTKTPTDTWQTGFFALTIIIIFIMNSAGAIFQGGLFGIAGMFPSKYMTAVVSGQALGGVFASGARIVSLAAGADDVTSAFIYFMIAVGVMLLTMSSYLYMTSTDFFKHYTNCQSVDVNEKKAEQNEETFVAGQLRVFKKIWPLAISCCLVFWVTLAVFPVICVRIQSTYENEAWRDIYFQPVATFLLFNIGDYLGRQVAGLIAWPGKNSRLIPLFVVLRVVFIPLFLMCNNNLEAMPDYFENDGFYIAIMLLFSISNGYLSSLCMMFGPGLVDEKDAEKAGSLMAAFLGLGLMMGGFSSFAVATIK